MTKPSEIRLQKSVGLPAGEILLFVMAMMR